jgi:cation transport ATPase
VLAVARKARRIVVQNLVWAGAYNLIAVPAAVLGYVDPLVAAGGMATSSLIVILNAMRAAHPALWQRSASTKVSLDPAPTAAGPSMSSV